MTGSDSEDRARIPEQSAMDVIDRLLSYSNEEPIDRMVVVCLDPDGEHLSIYSNARSEQEMMGMLYDALSQIKIQAYNGEV